MGRKKKPANYYNEARKLYDLELQRTSSSSIKLCPPCLDTEGIVRQRIDLLHQNKFCAIQIYGAEIDALRFKWLHSRTTKHFNQIWNQGFSSPLIEHFARQELNDSSYTDFETGAV